MIRSLALVLTACCGLAHASDWLQFGADSQHSGTNPTENGYATPGNTLVYTATLPSPVDAAPIFVAAVVTPFGPRDALFVTTVDGALLAIDSANGQVLWSHRAVGAATLTQSSPAVGPDRQFVYSYGFDGKVHKYKIGDGTEIVDAAWPQTVTLKPQLDKVAAALTIAEAANGHTYLYAVTDSYFDVGDFQGHVVAIDLAEGTHVVFNPQCSSFATFFVANGTTQGVAQNDCPAVPSGKAGQTANSGIWGRAGVTFDAALDRVLFTTGNGAFDPSNAAGNGMDWGDTVLAVHADGTGGTAGVPVDSFTPLSYAALLAADADLGSTSPALIPAPALSRFPHLAMQGGKDGCVRLLNLDDMSGTGSPGHVGGELQAFPLLGVTDQCALGGNLATFKAQPAVWVDPADATTWVFIGHNSGFVAYQLTFDAMGYPALTTRWTAAEAGSSASVAGGIVYYVNSGSFHARDARSGVSLWSSNQIGAIHWQSPIVANGRLYVCDQSGTLLAFQLDGIFRSSIE